MAKVSNGQLRMIWGAARNVGMDEDTLRAVVKNITGSESLSRMNKTQAGKVIDYLEYLQGNQPGFNMASKQQLWKIEQLARELGWSDSPARLAGFLKKYAGVDNIKWLNADMAWRVIEGLKRILKRQEKAAAGQGGR